jgi:hypothetical protein
MGWSEVAARNHALRLEPEGWLGREPMLRGEGSLFFATRKGVRLDGCLDDPPGSHAVGSVAEDRELRASSSESSESDGISAV